jgi:hypothetical protein
VSNSLDRRRDVRTVREFKKDIREATKREQMLMDLWVKEMKFRGKEITYQDHGIDNTGKFTEYSDSRPDFEVTINGRKQLIEIKSNPYFHKQTFKVWDLKTYVEYGASILLFFGLGHDKTTVDKTTTKWGIIRPDKIKHMLRYKKHQKGDEKWGHKEVIIIYPKDYDKYFKTERLKHLKDDKDGN